MKEFYNNREIPGDITLGECRNFILTGSTLNKVSDLAKRSMEIKFIDPLTEQEYSDNMSIAEFRELCNQIPSRGVIRISGSDGGLHIPARPKEIA